MPNGIESTETNSSSSWLTPNGGAGGRSTPSISPSSVFVSSGPSSRFPDPVIEGECVVEFTIAVRAYGVYEKIELVIAKNIMDAARLRFGREAFTLKDEAGRLVLYSKEAIEYTEAGMPANNLILVKEGI